jgi:hypothetical protein
MPAISSNTNGSLDTTTDSDNTSDFSTDGKLLVDFDSGTDGIVTTDLPGGTVPSLSVAGNESLRVHEGNAH